jgi:hypothetical protein
MKTIILLTALLFLSTSAYSYFDMSCVNQCTDNGYSTSYCFKKCSNDDSSNNRPNYSYGVDLGCINDCTNDGNSYSECKELCG